MAAGAGWRLRAMACKAAPKPPSKKLGTKIAPKTPPSRTLSIKQATTRSQKPAYTRVPAGSQCGETAVAALIEPSARAGAAAAAAVAAAVPQTWQKAEPGERLLPHFEQNMETPWLIRMVSGEMLQEAVK